METEQQQSSPRSSWLKRIWKWTKRLLLVLILLFVVLFAILQIPSVQTWTIRQLKTRIEKTTDTEVEIEYVYLSFFDRLRLQEVSIMDSTLDTILFSKSIEVDFDLSPATLFSQGLVVEGITLSGTQLNLIYDEPKTKNKFSAFLQKLLPPKDPSKKKKGKGLPLDLRVLNLKNFRFLEYNKPKGNILEILVPSGSIGIEELNFPNNRLIFSSANFNNPIVNVEKEPIEDMSVFEPYDTSEAWTDTTGLLIAIHDLQLNAGTFLLQNFRKAPVKLTPDDQLDYQHMNVLDINIDVDSLEFHEWDFSFYGIANSIACRENSGFELTKLSAEEVSVTPTGTEILGLQLITPKSNISDTLIFNYDQYIDFEDFERKVKVDGRMNDAEVAIEDITVFAPRLIENAFFRNNIKEVIKVNGRVYGEVNNLKGRNIDLELAGDTKIVGRFSFNNLTQKGEEVLSLGLTDLRTSMRSLRQLIPRFNPPANFDKLGTIRFKGFFDGLLDDFVADGSMSSDLGDATMDMRLNLKEGKDNARYSGNLNLINFDVGKWTGSKDIGKINMTTRIFDGIGLSGENVSARLEADIRSFRFKDYNYQNALIEGALSYNMFDGALVVRDENIDFEFIGEINLEEGIPYYNFDAFVKKLDLYQLNLSKEKLELSGNINLALQNQKLSDLEGDISLLEFNILQNDTSLYELGEVYIRSQLDYLGNKSFSIDSDILTCEVYGLFDLEQIPNTISEYLHQHYGGIAKKLKFKRPSKEIDPSTFEYNVRVLNSNGLERLISPNLGALTDIDINGRFDSFQDSLELEINAPNFELGTIALQDVAVRLRSEGKEGNLDFAVDSTIINDKRGLAPITFISLLEGDTILFGLNYSYSSPFSDNMFFSNQVVDKLNLNGTFAIIDSSDFYLEMDQSDLVILENRWNLLPNNYIRFNDSTLTINNLKFYKDDQVISLYQRGEKGVELELKGLNFDYIEEVWDYKPLNFRGPYDLFLSFDDVFEMKGLNVSAQADTLWINEDDWGQFRLDASAPDLKSDLHAYATITKEKENRQLILEGDFKLADAIENPKLDEQKATYFDFDLGINNFPMAIGEYFVAPNVTDITGTFDAQLRIYGLKKPNISGNMGLHNGEFTVDYLKTTYHFDDANIDVDNELFNATGTVIRDKYNHSAILYGGLSHNHLKDLGVNARLKTDRFLALDTKKGDNKMFYGQAMGQGEVRFSGSLKQTNIYVNAIVSDSSFLTIPVNSDRDASNLKFL
ncbi:MAG: hypothetical protein AAFO07_15170, partial [Bacteroidota bacterium]